MDTLERKLNHANQMVKDLEKANSDKKIQITGWQKLLTKLLEEGRITKQEIKEFTYKKTDLKNNENEF